MRTKLLLSLSGFLILSLVASVQDASADTAYSRRCMRTPGFEYDNVDQDNDGLKDWEEDRNHNCQLDPGESVPYVPFDGDPRPVASDASAETKLKMAQDTDSDGIDDLHEYFRNDAAHDEYVREVGALAAESQGLRNLNQTQKDRIFRCPDQPNPFNCDGNDNLHNANDQESDGDGIPDKFENCGGDIEGNVAGARYWDPEMNSIQQGTPEEQPIAEREGEAYTKCLSPARLAFFGDKTYLWQETDPYSKDTDGDGILEGPVSPTKDLCPNQEGGEILPPDSEEASSADFSCVAALCRPDLLAKLNADWDTDRDGKPDIKEDLNKSCVVDYIEASQESSPFKYNTDNDCVDLDGDGACSESEIENNPLSDVDDPCPLDPDPKCAYVCKPGGFGDPAAENPNAAGDPKYGRHAGHGTNVDRNTTDYDGDNLSDFTEDSDGNCEYTRPNDLRGAKMGRSVVGPETDWRDDDTDDDAYGYDENGDEVALFDPFLELQQARGTDQYDRCPHLNPDDDESNGWPHCLRHYCNKPDLGRRLNYVINNDSTNDADGDGLKDIEEDRNGNCHYDAARPERNETVSRETNWLEPDSDFDGVPDLRDACGSQPALWQADDYDGDGLTNGQEDADHDCFVDPFETDPYVNEIDENGFEDRDRLCRSNRDLWKDLDSDGDGLKNGDEDANPNCELDQWETDPFSDDTDQDGIPDGDDACRHLHTSFHERWASLDADFDGLPNGDEDANQNCEIDQFETNPYSADTDGDGRQDRDDSCGHPKLHAQWATRDADGDTLKNGDEDADGNCQVGPYESDPFRADTDGDGLNDFEDPCVYDSDPLCLTRCNPDTSFDNAEKDSDGDGLKDVEEDSNKNCLFFGITVQNGHGPTQPDPFDTSIYARDTDGDGLSDRVDGCQKLPDISGVLTSITVPVSLEEEVCAREQCLAAAGLKPGELKDSDRDGIPDIKEDPDFDCIISAESETDRFNADTDGDGLSDGVEDSNKNGTVDIDREHGTGETDPRDADTDDDGIPDGVEDANQNGRYDYGELNPRMPDTDGDKILDSLEDRNKNGRWDGGQLLATGPCRLTDASGQRILDATGNPLVPETSGYLKDSDLDGIDDGAEDSNMNGVFTNIGSRFKSTLMTVGQPMSVDDVIEFGESHPCDNDTDGDGLFDGQEDLNGDGSLNWKDGETSPISPHTFGEPDSSRLERKLGMSGCTLIPSE